MEYLPWGSLNGPGILRKGSVISFSCPTSKLSYLPKRFILSTHSLSCETREGDSHLRWAWFWALSIIPYAHFCYRNSHPDKEVNGAWKSLSQSATRPRVLLTFLPLRFLYGTRYRSLKKEDGWKNWRKNEGSTKSESQPDTVKSPPRKSEEEHYLQYNGRNQTI
jgi:hypothetical protein